MKKTEYEVIRWKRNGSSFSFLDEEEFRQKVTEMKDNLLGDEKLQLIKRVIEEEPIN